MVCVLGSSGDVFCNLAVQMSGRGIALKFFVPPARRHCCRVTSSSGSSAPGVSMGDFAGEMG